jgi:hypothetical protein
MPLIRDPLQLVPPCRDAAIKALAACNAMSLRIFVNETLRSQNVQDAYYLQGRDTLENVNLARMKAGLRIIGVGENQHMITWTHKSKHTEGKAMDIYPMDKYGKILWGAPKSEFQKIADVIKPFGFDWGGDWEPAKQDLPHFQWRET